MTLVSMFIHENIYPNTSWRGENAECKEFSLGLRSLKVGKLKEEAGRQGVQG